MSQSSAALQNFLIRMVRVDSDLVIKASLKWYGINGINGVQEIMGIGDSNHYGV